MAGAISVSPKLVGTASGLTGFLQMGIGAAISYATGWMLADSASPLVAVMVCTALLAALIHWLGGRGNW
jgi:DHA1 family bicyclomycin/chloramphenicol resistance-like MFS transporter